jgi:hypothetical protein
MAADRSAPQLPGTSVKWTATVNGGRNVEYKWLVHDGAQWSAVTGWSAQNTFTWTPPTANSGYRVGIWVRSNGNTNDQAEVTSSEDFPIKAATVMAPPPAPVAPTATAPLTGVNLTTSKVAPQTANTTIVATATTQGGGAPQTFRWLINDGYGWKTVTGWTSSNTFAWTPTTPGTYFVGVWVRAAGNISDNYDVSSSLPFIIQ